MKSWKSLLLRVLGASLCLVALNGCRTFSPWEVYRTEVPGAVQPSAACCA